MDLSLARETTAGDKPKGNRCCHSSFTSTSHLPPSSSRGGRQSPNDSPGLCKVPLFHGQCSHMSLHLLCAGKECNFLPIRDPNQNREEIHPMPRGESATISVLVQRLYLNPLPVTQLAPSLKSSFIDGSKSGALFIAWMTT